MKNTENTCNMENCFWLTNFLCSKNTENTKFIEHKNGFSVLIVFKIRKQTGLSLISSLFHHERFLDNDL